MTTAAIIATSAQAIVIATSMGIGADAEVRDHQPTTNFGASTELGTRVVDNLPLGNANDGNDRFSAMYLKFDITGQSSLPNPTASVRLTYRNTNLTPNRIHDTTPPGNNFDYRTGIAFYGLDRDNVGNNWSEATINYVTAPGMSNGGDFNNGTKDFDFVDPDGAGPMRAPLTPLGIALFPEAPPQNQLPVGGELIFNSDLLNDFVAQSLIAGKPSVTIVASIVHDGKIPINDWKNFNYLFNPKEQTTLSVDTSYDADTNNLDNPLGSPWSGASNAADASGFSPFSPQLILQPNFPKVHEGFDYSPPGANLSSANGGNAFAGPWNSVSVNANYRIGEASLSFPGLATTGNHVTTGSHDAGVGSIICRLGTPLGQPGTTQYLSFVVRPEGTLHEGQFNGYFGLLINGTTDLFIGKPGGGTIDQFVLENNGGTLQHASGTTIEVGEEYLLVLRADFAAGNDVFTLYVNPQPGSVEPSSGTIKSDSNVGIFDELLLYGTGAFSLDELRIGPSFADVVPIALPGDYNLNGVVDTADYTRWRDNLGSSNTLLNDDTAGVDTDDYDRWRTHFGQTAGSGAEQFAAAPEPSSLPLLAIALFFCPNHLRRRRT